MCANVAAACRLNDIDGNQETREFCTSDSGSEQNKSLVKFSVYKVASWVPCKFGAHLRTTNKVIQYSSLHSSDN